MWISYFGALKLFLSNSGGEFNDEGYRQMNEKLNTETYTTAAESPFSYSTVECYSLIVVKAMEKMLQDEKFVPEITLACPFSAKNALQNHFGHCSNELVFGFNINTISV